MHSVRRGKRNGVAKPERVTVSTKLERHWFEQVAALADRNASSMSGAASLLIKEALEARQSAREASPETV